MYENSQEESALLRKSAAEIATAVASLVSFDIVITDAAGRVAGSSAAQWKDLTLAPARKASERGEVVEDPPHGDVSGGLYCPVRLLNGRVAGTVMIAGAPARARPFAAIVCRQVELLLRERELYAFAGNRERTLEKLVQDIGSFVPGVSNEGMLASRAAEFGYDKDRDYIVVAVDLYQLGRFASEARKQIRGRSDILNVKKAVLASIRKVFDDPGCISATLGNNRFVILHASPDESGTARPDATRRAAQRALSAIDEFGLKAAVGVGTPARGIPALAVSYQDAWKALFLGKKFCQRPGVYDIADYRLEDIITTIDAPARARYVQAVTGAFRGSSDWEQIRQTTRAWCESAFSLIEAAKLLHIHRNTLIYRMDKISRETGIDFRSFRTCLNLYLALVMDQYTGPAVKE